MRRLWIKHSGTISVVAAVLFIVFFVAGFVLEFALMPIVAMIMLVIGVVSFLTHVRRR